MLNAEILEKLPAKTCILNAARGKIVDEPSILSIFKGYYCTDVYWNEPQINPDIINRALIATPHIAGHTIEAKRNITQQLSQAIHLFFGLPQRTDLGSKQNLQIINSKNWKKIALENYHPLIETQALKAFPSAENFLNLRRLHNFRHDFPWKN
jgi:erythronate-4-phosphate dehydrogenase